MISFKECVFESIILLVSALNKKESYLFKFSSDILLNWNKEGKYINLETGTVALTAIVINTLEIMLWGKGNYIQ